jgi:hypothetical protein
MVDGGWWMVDGGWWMTSNEQSSIDNGLIADRLIAYVARVVDQAANGGHWH